MMTTKLIMKTSKNWSKINGAILAANRKEGARLVLVALLFLLGKTTVAGEAGHNPFLASANQQLAQTIEYIFQENYPAADSVCSEIISDYPQHPAGYFMKGILHWKQGYFLNRYNEYNDSTLIWFSQAIDIADRGMKTTPGDASIYFFAGGAYGYQGSVYARRKSWLKTGMAAYHGIRLLEKSMAMDSSLYDIYYGSGLYHVLASHQPGIIRWLQRLLPIPAGDAKLGLQYLQLAVNKGEFTSLAAVSALGLAYVYYENEYEKAIELLSPLVARYPRNLDFMTNLINAYFYREMTRPTNDWQPVLKLIDQARQEVRTRNIDIQTWWLDKFDFIEGYSDYMNGELDSAARILGAYCNKYPQKGDSYLTALGYLTLGKIADRQSNRKEAIAYYKKVSGLEQMGNEKQLAEKYLQNPFQNETNSNPFNGAFADIQDRP